MNSLVSRISNAVVLISAIALASPAMARGNSHVDYAKVIDVEPIIKTFEHRTPTETCWNERVAHQREHRGRGDDSIVGTVVGGVIGGAIGNAVGHKKRNKQVGAAVGAVLGAAIGHDVTRGRHRPSHVETYYTNERRCETSYDVTYTEEPVGYWVTYKYKKQKHRTRMENHPGDRIRVRVTVEPM